MPENIRQKRLKILEYFDAYICHHENDDKYMHGHIPRFFVFFCLILSNIKLIFRLSNMYHKVCHAYMPIVFRLGKIVMTK